jgi:hypothetical protein
MRFFIRVFFALLTLKFDKEINIPDEHHIDFVFGKGDYTVETCKVLCDSYDGIYPSDHYPV